MSRDYEADLKVCEAATPGPWEHDTSGVFCMAYGAEGGPVLDMHDPKTPPVGGIGSVGDPYPRGDNHPSENMKFIAMSREALPWYITQLRALEHELGRYRAAFDHLRTLCRCDCGEPWTGRGMHDPVQCNFWLIGEMEAVLSSPSKEGARG